MHTRKYLYGLMGLLSLLGFIGIFTDQKRFLLFFAFAFEFEYFFKSSDEMMDAYMGKSASQAFYCGMIITALVTLGGVVFFGKTGNESLTFAFSQGWSVSIIVYFFSTAYYQLKERYGIAHDTE